MRAFFLLLLSLPKKKKNKKDPHPTFSRKREKAQKAEERLKLGPLGPDQRGMTDSFAFARDSLNSHFHAFRK